MGMGDQFVATFITKTDELARRLKQWNEWRLESELALERRTINIRIEQESDDKAQRKAAQLLKANIHWNQSEEVRLKLVERQREDTRKWLMSLFTMLKRNANTWIFFIGWTSSMVIWGWLGGLNTPVGITCHTRASLCYSLRFWGVKKAAFEPKPPLCTKTKLGLMCLVEPAAKKKSAPTHGSAATKHYR